MNVGMHALGVADICRALREKHDFRTLMRTPEIAANLARSVLELAGARF